MGKSAYTKEVTLEILYDETLKAKTELNLLIEASEARALLKIE